MPTNQVAFLDAKETKLVVRDETYTSPGPGFVVIKVGAAAVNPCDVGMQDTGMLVQSFPYILGCDAAGTIEEVGPGVENLKVGDRVLGMCAAVIVIFENGNFDIKQLPGAGGFQLYTIAQAEVVSKIPDTMSFEEGSVLPLAALTAASSLRSVLQLDYSSMNPTAKSTYLCVWGGASSVGSTAIQFAVNAGYRVITTCSAHNIAYCEELGAEKAFDYKSTAMFDEVAAFLEGKKLVGIMNAISRGDTTEQCVQVARRSEFEGTKVVCSVMPGSNQDYPDGVKVTALAAHLRGDEVAKVFAEFLPAALESGHFKAKPDPLVVGKGLANAQTALDTHKAGISAKKVVVTI